MNRFGARQWSLAQLSSWASVLVSLLILTTAVQADNSPQINTDDWNWDSFSADDMTPAETSRSRMDQEMPQLPPGKAEPDLEASPQPVKPFLSSIPDFDVIPAKKTASMYPCSSCHDWRKLNPTPRKLDKPHNNFELKHSLHGKGEYWCFTCHKLDNPQGIKDLEGNNLNTNESYLLCSQCHSAQAKDWAFGIHGKRIGSWNGRRQSYDCAACHYQHQPRLKPRTPKSGPQIRTQLEKPAHWQPNSTIKHETLWQKYSNSAKQD